MICNKRDSHVASIRSNFLGNSIHKQGYDCVKSASVLDAILEAMLNTNLKRVDKHKVREDRSANSQRSRSEGATASTLSLLKW